MQAIAAAWTYTGEYRDVDTELASYDAVTLAVEYALRLRVNEVIGELEFGS